MATPSAVEEASKKTVTESVETEGGVTTTTTTTTTITKTTEETPVETVVETQLVQETKPEEEVGKVTEEEEVGKVTEEEVGKVTEEEVGKVTEEVGTKVTEEIVETKTEVEVVEATAEEVKTTEEIKTTVEIIEVVEEKEEVAKQAEEEVKEITCGPLYKQTRHILFNWSLKYFVFGDENPLSLAQLQIYHDKAIKSASAPEQTESEYEKQFKSLFSIIAHATVTGKGLLFYYKSEKETKPQGIISLAEVTGVESNKGSGKPHTFTIKTTGREYIVHANSEQELKQWIKAIEDNVETAKEISKEVQTKDDYKVTYEKLVKKKLFSGGKLSDDLVISSDEDAEPKEPRRRATFPSLFGFRKPEATTSETKTEEKTEGTSETKEVVETIVSTEEVITTEKVESPKKTGSVFSSFFRSKSPTSTEDTKDIDAKVETEKVVEETVVAETSTAAETTEVKKEEEKKEEEKSGIWKIWSGAKKAVTKEETATPKKEEVTEETVEEIVTTTEIKEVEIKEPEAKEPEAKETEVKKENMIKRRLTKMFSGTKAEPKVAEKTEQVEETETKVEETETKVEETETKVEETVKVEEAEKVEVVEVTEVVENAVSTSEKPEEVKTDNIEVKRTQSVFKRISGKFLPKKQQSQDDTTHGKEPSEAAASGGSEVAALETTNATETSDSEEIRVKKASSAKHGILKKEAGFLRQLFPRDFIFEKEYGTITYYNTGEKPGPGKVIKITSDVKVNKLEGNKFNIVLSERTYHLEATEPEERDEWVTLLSDYITAIPPPIPSKEVTDDVKEEASTQVTESTEAKVAAELYETAAKDVTTIETQEVKEIVPEADSKTETTTEIETPVETITTTETAIVAEEAAKTS